MELTTLKNEILAAIESASALDTLEEVRVKALGKKGTLTELMKTLGAMAPEERKVFGQQINEVKTTVAQALESRKKALEEAALNARLATEKVDVTLPVRPENQGRIHPVTQVMQEMLTIFAGMGFELAEGPDVDDDWHNFEALNTPPNHPARQAQATFFMKNANALLRTQTSTVQIRTMENQKPPIKIVAPGRCYRVDSDATHSPMFHQIEGLVVDEKTTLAHLKGVFVDFIRQFFDAKEVPVRFRPHFFPFTEPSYEADVGGELAASLGKEWLEVFCCGMVDPNVLKNCGLDPTVYQGFAFGLGLDRFAMLKYGIPDLRNFFDADMRWIKHYGFAPLDVPSVTGGLTMNAGVKK